MKIEESASKSLLILSISGIIAKLLSTFYVPLLQAILGPAGVGIYSRSYDIFIFAYSVATMGCQPAVAKVVSEFTVLKKDSSDVLKVSRKIFGLISIVFSLLILIVLHPCVKYFQIQSSYYSILFLIPSITITAILGAYRGYFQGSGKMNYIAISQVLEQLLNVILSLIFAYFFVKVSLPLGSAGATIGTTLGALFAVIYLIYFFRKKFNFTDNNKISKTIIQSKLLKYAIPISLLAIIQNAGSLINMLTINTRLLHGGFSSIQSDILYGYLYYFKTLIGAPLIIITSIGIVLLPSISKAYSINNINRSKYLSHRGLKLGLIISIPTSIGLYSLSNELYSVLFKGEGTTLMILGSGLFILMTLTQIQNIILQGLNQFKLMIISFSLGMFINIVLTYILVGIKSINIYGVLIANTFLYLIPIIINSISIYKTLNYNPLKLKNILNPLIAGIIMLIVILIIELPLKSFKSSINSSLIFYIYNLVYIIIVTLIGSIVYFKSLVKLKGLSKDDIEILPNKISKILLKFM